MNLIKRLAIAAAFLTATQLIGCDKKETIIMHEDATQVLSNLLSAPQNVDMTIGVNSSFGISPLPGGNAQTPWTILFGQIPQKQSIGTLLINNNDIPYTGSGYSRQCDSALSSDLLLGKMNQVNFVSNNSSLPSFQGDFYAPATTLLSFTGLENYKVNRTKDIRIEWQADELYNNSAANGRSWMLVQGGNDGDTRDKSEVLVKELHDADGYVVLTAAELSAFEGFEYITIIYGKGTNKELQAGNKTIMMQSQNFSYSDIYFQ